MALRLARMAPQLALVNRLSLAAYHQNHSMPFTMPSKTMFVDVETTGLPKKVEGVCTPANPECYDSARLLEVGYRIHDKEGNEVSNYTSLIKPKDFKVRATHIHGITEAHADVYGKDVEEVLEQLHDDLSDVDLVVGHNVSFDRGVLLSECHRVQDFGKVDMLEHVDWKCTMEMGKEVFGKRLSLVNLYQQLYGIEVPHVHRSLNDVDLCIDAYYALKKFDSDIH